MLLAVALGACASTPQASAPLQWRAGFVELEAHDARIAEEAGALSIEGDVLLALPDWRAVVRVRGDAKLKREGDGVRVSAGRVRVASPISAAHSVRVFVSGGHVEARGAVLEVTQGNGFGLARLLEGEGRFHATDGRVVAVPSGELVRWPLPKAP